MDKITPAGHRGSEAEVPTDLLAGLSMKRISAPSPASGKPERVAPKVYGVMAIVSALTFATLTTGYQTLFSHQLFA